MHVRCVFLFVVWGGRLHCNLTNVFLVIILQSSERITKQGNIDLLLLLVLVIGQTKCYNCLKSSQVFSAKWINKTHLSPTPYLLYTSFTCNVAYSYQDSPHILRHFDHIPDNNDDYPPPHPLNTLKPLLLQLYPTQQNQ